MKNLKIFLFVILSFCITFINAQLNNKGISAKAYKLNDKIYKLVCNDQLEVNITALIGNDGILLVDDGTTGTSDSIKAELKKISSKEVKYVINTHFHSDHTGGNPVFGKDAQLIASREAVKSLNTWAFLEFDQPELAIPKNAIEKETDMKFNGEDLKLIPLPGGHSSGDIIVYFKNSGIVAVGDQIFSDQFPFVDLTNDGSYNKYKDHIEYFIKTFPENTIFITGHGRDYTINDVKQYLSMVIQTKDIVQKEMKMTKDLEEIKKKDILKDWEQWSKGFIDKNAWLGTLYDDISNAGKPRRLRAIDTLLSSAKTENIESTIKLYLHLKKNLYDKYLFQESVLNVLGYYLLKVKRVKDAIEVFKLNVKEYPSSSNVYDSLGEAYMVNGDKDISILNYKKSIELNPNNENAKAMIKKMESK
jgi:glyoxylase-like metal-dependent hydrolase (beta-lactamase superfamily II)